MIMTEAIITAMITGGLSLTGVIISNFVTARKSETAIMTAQAVTDTRLEELTREVRDHNQFARRMPVLEEQIKVINHRINDLENQNKQGGGIWNS